MRAEADHVKVILDFAPPWDPVGSVFVELIAFERGFDGFTFNNRSSCVDNSEGVFL